MQQIVLLTVPLVMLAAGLVERRLGPWAAAGLTSLPFVVLTGIIAVSTRSGPSGAVALSGGLAAHVGVQVLAVGALRAVAHRHGPVTAVAATVAVYAAGCVLVARLDLAAACLTGAGLLAVGRRYTRPRPGRTEPGTPTPAAPLAIRALIAWSAAESLTIAARWSGPGLAGAVGAFPAMTLTLAVMVWRTGGLDGLTAVVGGLVRSLPAYLAFCLTFTVVAAPLGVAAALILSVCGCAVVLLAVSGQPMFSARTCSPVSST